MPAIPRERRMFVSVLLCGVCLIVAIIWTVGGCGETNDDRRQISQHTKDLAAKVKAAPDSAEGKAAMKELIKILNGDWSFARSQACYAIDELALGPLATPAVPDLMRASKCGDPFVEQAAVRALASLGPAASPAVDLLIERIEDALPRNDYSVLPTLDAAKALGNIGEPALKAVPVLERASKSSDKFLAEEAQKSLDKLKRLADAQSKDKRSAE